MTRAKTKWAERQQLQRKQMEKFTLAIDRLFRALDRALCPHRRRGFRADPVAVAHRLLNTLPVTRKVTGTGWSEETRAAHQAAIVEHSARMRGKYA